MKRKALVVDDDRFMVKTLSDLLELNGWEVTGAYSGDSAVAAAASDGFDVVIMDIKMPGLDGVSALKAMKAIKPDLRVVLMTAYAAHDLIADAEREGVLRVLPKPVDVAALLALLSDNSRGGKPVLLIDNDLTFLRVLSEVLTLRGYHTVVAESMEDAERLMLERRPAAVLLHMHLGSVSAGYAVAALHDLSPSVALILYSGRPGADQEIARALPSEWIHAYLQKPFDVDELTGVLDAVVG